jgi:hypothetical protein
MEQFYSASGEATGLEWAAPAAAGGKWVVHFM